MEKKIRKEKGIKTWHRLSTAERAKRARQGIDYVKKAKPKLPTLVHPNFFPIKIPDYELAPWDYNEKKKIIEHAKTILRCLYNIPGFNEVPIGKMKVSKTFYNG